MSYYEGSNWQARKEDEKKPLYEKEDVRKNPPAGVNDADEKEVMIQAFQKVYKIFKRREWIMEGRGSYRYDDDRYKEEVRYLFDEFDGIWNDTWKNIHSKTFEYREKIIKEYLESIAGSVSNSVEQRAKGGIWVKVSNGGYNLEVKELNLPKHGVDVYIRYDNASQKMAGDRFTIIELYENGWPDIEWMDETQSIPGSESQAQDWISVEDRLPEKNGYYICWCGHEPGLIHFHVDSGWQNGFYDNVVTHWQRLTPPPTSPK